MPMTMKADRCRAEHLNMWMVEPAWFNTQVELVNKGIIKAQESDNPVDPDERLYDLADGIAQINLKGPLMKGWSKYGGTSSVSARAAVRQAVKDEDVRAILLFIDSPGGTVAGTSELAADVRAANAAKPVFVHVEDLCASAAYWVASQASAIFAIPTAEIGSIGTVMQLVDNSAANETAGIKVHTLSTGAYKGAGFDGNPLTEDQLGYFQQRVNDLNKHFLNGVKVGRQMTAEQLKPIADGRVFVAAEARKLGLVDDVSSIDETRKYVKKFIRMNELKAMKAEAEVEAIQKGLLPINKARAVVSKSITPMDTAAASLRQKYGLADTVDVRFAACLVDVSAKSIDGKTENPDPHYVLARITTERKDRDKEVLIPQGMVATEFEEMGAVFWNHNYNLPVAKAGKLSRTLDAVLSEAFFAKRPADFTGEFFPDYVRALVQQGIVKGVSVGFIPIEQRRPTAKDREKYGEDVKLVYSKWKILEWSFAPVQSNVDAVVLDAVEKGIVSKAAALELFEGYLSAEVSEQVRIIPVLPPQQPKQTATPPDAPTGEKTPENGNSGPGNGPVDPPKPRRRLVVVVDPPPAPAPRRISVVSVAAAAVSKARGRVFGLPPER